MSITVAESLAEPALTTPFTLFRVEVGAVEQLSTNIRRFTFVGGDLAHIADNGRDQRIKLIFPLPDLGLALMPPGPDWYAEWRELPDDQRNPIRTYTIRAARPELREIDVDIALHGRIGVASAWAHDAVVGSELMINGPDSRHTAGQGGVDFLPPATTGRYLLAGDETALPAIASILESLPADAVGEALIEVGHPSDAAAVGCAPAGMRIQVLRRNGGAHGSVLIDAVVAAAGRLTVGEDTAAPDELEDVDVDVSLLWEVPTDASGFGPAQASTELYAWLAGEAAMIKTLRRHLVTERGVHRKSVAFMGYWRLGRAEDNT